MGSFNETKDVVIEIDYKDGDNQIAYFDCVHSLHYYDGDELAIGEFSYDTENYPTTLEDDDINRISEQVSEYLTERFCRGLSSVNDGDTISLEVN